MITIQPAATCNPTVFKGFDPEFARRALAMISDQVTSVRSKPTIVKPAYAPFRPLSEHAREATVAAPAEPLELPSYLFKEEEYIRHFGLAK